MPRETPDRDGSAEWPRRGSERAERARARVEAEGGTFVEEAYVWPSLEKGNTLARRHGALVRDISAEPMVAELVRGVLESRPDLHDFPEAVAAWADSECRAWLLRRYLNSEGMFNAKGAVRNNVLKFLVSFDRRAESARIRLALDPPSAALLTSAAAGAEMSLDDLRRRGREALDANSDGGDGGSAAEGTSSGMHPELGEPGRG